MTQRTPAHEGEVGHQRGKRHQGLRKAEISLAFHLHTEKAEFAAFLHARTVPDVIFSTHQCSWRQQDPKYVMIYRLNHAATARKLYETNGTERHREVMPTEKVFER